MQHIINMENWNWFKDMLREAQIKKYSKEDYINMIGKEIEKVVGDNCLIIFFGSILSDKFGRTSDIDVALYCKEKLSDKEFLEIINNLDNLPILSEIDIVDIKRLKNTKLLKNILEGRVWKNIPELLRDLESYIENLEK